MKLSPQSAGVLLSLSSKAAPAALLDKGAFAATMQDLMTPPSGPAVAAVTQSPAGGLPQIAARIRPVTSPQETHSSAGEEHIGTGSVPLQTSIVATSNAATPVPHDVMRHALAPQPSIQISSATEEIPELLISKPVLKNPIEKSVLPQPLYALPRELGLTADTHAPSRAEHKAGVERRDPTNPATGHSPEILLAAATPVHCPIPVPVPQPCSPEQTFSEKNVQPTIHSIDKAGGSRRSASMSQSVVTAPTITSKSCSELLQLAREETPLKKVATVMDLPPLGPTSKTTVPSALPRSNQDNLPGLAVHSKEGHETTTSQVDDHASQEAGKTSSAETKPVLPAESSIHPALDLSSAPRPPSANTPDPSPAIHKPEALTETHRAPANAAQVLQRMDTAAPPGAVQLRVDARHLDIGVSSGVLGWVEVRATASSSGRVDAALHVQTNSSAHMLTAQSKEIATYAREHSVELGQLSVGVGTGDSARGNSRASMHDGAGKDDIALVRKPMKSPASNEPQQPPEKVSFISVRA